MILLSLCYTYQNFAHKGSNWPENEAQSLDFGHLLTIFAVFEAVHFETSLQPMTMIFYYILVVTI